MSASQAQAYTTTVEGSDAIDCDVGNMAAFHNAYDSSRDIDSQARDVVQVLFNTLFSQPTHRTEEGIIAELPAPSSILPRSKPLPKAAESTRWEEFAKSRGILKRKKQRMLWDDMEEKYKPRWGYKRANDAETQDWVREVKAGDDPMNDPFTARIDEKKSRVSRQKKREERNWRRKAGRKPSVGVAEAAEAATELKLKAKNAEKQKQKKRESQREKEMGKGKKKRGLGKREVELSDDSGNESGKRKGKGKGEGKGKRRRVGGGGGGGGEGGGIPATLMAGRGRGEAKRQDMSRALDVAIEATSKRGMRQRSGDFSSVTRKKRRVAQDNTGSAAEQRKVKSIATGVLRSQSKPVLDKNRAARYQQQVEEMAARSNFRERGGKGGKRRR